MARDLTSHTMIGPSTRRVRPARSLRPLQTSDLRRDANARRRERSMAGVGGERESEQGPVEGRASEAKPPTGRAITLQEAVEIPS